MFAVPLGPDAELRPLQPWQSTEFLANLDRCRDHISPWVGASFVATDAASATAVLQGYADRTARDDGGIWGIWLEGVLVGGVMFVAFSTVTGTCEAGCWLEPGAQGRGLVVRAMQVLLGWAFDERGMNRVEWRTNADNVRSIATARRLGMTRDGTLRQVYRTPDGGIDIEVWSLLSHEWRGRTWQSGVSPTSRPG